MAHVDRRSDLLAAGLTDDDIQRRRRKELVSIRAGRYVERSTLATLTPFSRHRLLAVTAAADLSDDAVLSHVSAACLLGLPLWGLDLRTVQITRPGSGGGHRRRSLHTRYARLADDQIVEVGGFRVTSAARTLVDLGRSAAFESAVVNADAALRLGLVTAEQLTQACSRAAGTPGAGRARQVIAFADGRSESVGESRSRVAIHRAGLPPPDLQVKIFSATGTLVGRTDFGWEDRRTLGEFDGRIKYGRLARPGQSAGDVAFEEKCREDRIRDEGWRVVRWTWGELDAAGTATERIRRALRLP